MYDQTSRSAIGKALKGEGGDITKWLVSGGCLASTGMHIWAMVSSFLEGGAELREISSCRIGAGNHNSYRLT